VAEPRFDDAFTSGNNTVEDRLKRYYGPSLLILVGVSLVVFGIVALGHFYQREGWLVMAAGSVLLLLGALFARSRYRRIPDGGYGSEPYPKPGSSRGRES